MTTPLPHVPLGNPQLDASQAGGDILSGLVQQNIRQRQLALQEALGQSTIAHNTAAAGLETAQTGDVNEQEAERAHLNEPAGDPEAQMLTRMTGKPITADQLSGLNRADVHDMMKSWMLFQRLSLTQQGLTGHLDNQAYNNFIKNPDVSRALAAKDAYDRANSLLSSNQSVGYNDLFGAVSQLAVPNNARAVGQMLTRLSQTGVLKGPFNPYENMQLTLNRLTNTQGTLPLTPEMRTELTRTLQAMLVPHIAKYDRVKQTILHQMGANGTPIDPQYLDSGDPFADVRNLQNPANPNPQPTSGNPFIPVLQR